MSEYQLRTMTGLGNTLAGIFEAEIGQIERFDSADKLARYAGIPPAEKSSGKSKRKKHYIYGRRRLNQAFYTLALNQISSHRSEQLRNPEAAVTTKRNLAKVNLQRLPCGA